MIFKILLFDWLISHQAKFVLIDSSFAKLLPLVIPVTLSFAESLSVGFTRGPGSVQRELKEAVNIDLRKDRTCTAHECTRPDIDHGAHAPKWIVREHLSWLVVICLSGPLRLFEANLS